MSLRYKKIAFYILLVSTIIMIVLMFLQGRPLKTPSTSLGIINLELAGNSLAVESILDSWVELSTDSTDLIHIAIQNTWLDFLFILSYTSFLITCCLWAQAKPSLTLKLLALMAFLAGVLDVFENIGMLRSLHGSITDGNAFGTAVSAYFKWIIVALVLLMLALFYGRKITRKVRL